MRESEHFNLNLVEGSDIVNPLVTDVPNYESIDAQMFKNQNAGVQNATELKSGTVHAITRLVPDAQMITFTATSNFVAGDTFTVDGIQVSALTVRGEQLSTGAYVINSQVLAILKGTLLTVYGVGSETADNALALNGHPDTYFGTKESVDNAIATANAANELVNELKNSLTWKYVTVNLVVNSVGPWFEKIVPELNNAKEIKVLCAGVSATNNIIQFELLRIKSGYVTTQPYNFKIQNTENYDSIFDVRWNLDENKIGIRQTFKGTSDDYKMIVGISYR